MASFLKVLNSKEVTNLNLNQIKFKELKIPIITHLSQEMN